MHEIIDKPSSQCTADARCIANTRKEREALNLVDRTFSIFFQKSLGVKMSIYRMPKADRLKLVETINHDIREAFNQEDVDVIEKYFSDEDTYIRKNAYEAVARIYHDDASKHDLIIKMIDVLLETGAVKVRKSAVHALGEIGRFDSSKIMELLGRSLSDESKIVNDAVIGALKRMGEKNPEPTLTFARTFLHHPKPVIRREIVHGIELRGRTHPKEILPLLKELQDEKDSRVRKMIVHVVAQCSYKKGCIEIVLEMLKKWHDEILVSQILNEILKVHESYKNFAAKSVAQARNSINDFIANRT
ncbi:MAG TPA: HEAT repeat domain-containing protein [Candidatus Lokiarchaeia archaeon]|nr:HEAT repeat domain-containing protein [Candidatus Lokiarchaeia archaeon]